MRRHSQIVAAHPSCNCLLGYGEAVILRSSRGARTEIAPTQKQQEEEREVEYGRQSGGVHHKASPPMTRMGSSA